MRKTVYIVTIEDSGELMPLFTSDDLKGAVEYIQSHIKGTIKFCEKVEIINGRVKTLLNAIKEITAFLTNESIEELYDSLIAERVLQGLLDNINKPVKNIIWDYQIHEIELEG